MDYSQLSDFEINKRVADIVMNGTWRVRPSHPDNATGGWLYGSNGIQTYDLPDYCNNPADAWPIIESNYIALHPLKHKSVWIAVSDDQEHTFRDAKPMRAAMVIFLMSKESFNA